MRAALWVLRVLAVAAFLCVLAAIWLPDARWQWLVTSVVLAVAAGMTSVAIDQGRKSDSIDSHIEDFFNGQKGNGDG